MLAYTGIGETRRAGSAGRTSTRSGHAARREKGNKHAEKPIPYDLWAILRAAADPRTYRRGRTTT